ncbi:HSP20-like chaperone, partial [Tilletiaria anomala UBC 951]
GDKLVVTAEVPGIKKEDLHISLDDKTRKLTISGAFKSSYDSSSMVAAQEQQVQSQGQQTPVADSASSQISGVASATTRTSDHHVQMQQSHQPGKGPVSRPLVSERTFGSFSRSWVLPKSVQTDEDANVKASFENGLLRLELPKKAVSDKKEPRSIPIL